MSTLGQPVPPPPAAFTPDGVPGPTCEFKHVLFTRQKLKAPARIILVHTNAAPGPGDMESAWNWTHAAPNENTCPTYQVDRQRSSVGFIARKMLRSDEDAIANCTTSDAEDGHGDVSEWSLAIETADLGSNAGLGGFTDEQGEMVATIIAYESIVAPTIPLVTPTEWFGAGVGGHTDPFGYPFWTCFEGKTCPGTQKKAEIREWILPRAIEIHAAWTEGDLASSDEIMAELQATKLIAQAALEEATAAHTEAAAAHARIDRFADNEFSRDMATSKRDWERFTKLVAKLEALVPKS